jgi:hypothetical protein
VLLTTQAGLLQSAPAFFYAGFNLTIKDNNKTNPLKLR